MTEELSIADPWQPHRRSSRRGIGAESKSQPVAIPRRPGRRQHDCWSGSHEFAQQSMEEMDMRMSRSRDIRNGLRNSRPVSQTNRSAFSAATTSSSTSNHSSNCGSGDGGGGGGGGGGATAPGSGHAACLTIPDHDADHHRQWQHRQPREQQQHEAAAAAAAASAAGRSFGGTAHRDGVYGESEYLGSVYSGSPQYYHRHQSLRSGVDGGGGARRRSRNEYVYTVGSHQHYHAYGSSPPSYSPRSHVRAGGGGLLHRDGPFGLYGAEEEDEAGGRGGVVGGDDYDNNDVSSDGGDHPGNDDEDGICDGVFNLELL